MPARPLRDYQVAAAEFLAADVKPLRGRILADPPGFGKRLWIGTPIPTPTGWRTMGDLQVGDLAFDENGQPSPIVGVSPIAVATQSFRVTFNDGSYLLADADHEWLTWTHSARAARRHSEPGKRAGGHYGAKPTRTLPTVVTTNEIARTLTVESGKRLNHSVQLTRPVEYPEAQLPLDPYLLGAWLGNGGTGSGVLYMAAIDQGFWQLRLRNFQLKIRPPQRGGIEIRVGDLPQALRGLGLWGNKHIPAMYLTASVPQRRALLAGLMDTDGTVSTQGACCFDNTNPHLAAGVAELVHSLGGKTTLAVKIPRITNRPQATCADCYRVMFTPTFPVFELPRKRDRQNTVQRSTQNWRYIKSVEPIDPLPMRCIRVGSTGHLFLAGRSFIPTHNCTSAIGGARLRWERGQTKVPCIVVVSPALARFDWEREAKLTWPELDVQVPTKRPVRRKLETDDEFDKRCLAVIRDALNSSKPTLLVVSHQGAGAVLEHLRLNQRFLGTLIVDEAHAFKKDFVKRSSVARGLVARAEKSFLLTGTPIHNRAIDLHNLLDLCSLQAFGSKWTFARRYFQIQTDEYREHIGPLRDKVGLANAIEPYVLARTSREAFGALPPPVRKLVVVPGGASTRLAKPDAEWVNAQLRACAGKKIATVVNLALELDEPLVIYAYAKIHAGLIASKLAAHGVKCTLATGELTSPARAKVIEQWKAGATRVLVCTMEAVKESATLTRASAMIFADFDWLPGTMIQVEGRIDSARQPENERRPARYYYVAFEYGIDRDIAQRNIEKIDEAEGVVSKNVNAQGLRAVLAPLAPVQEKPADVLADLVARINATGKRLDLLR